MKTTIQSILRFYLPIILAFGFYNFGFCREIALLQNSDTVQINWLNEYAESLINLKPDSAISISQKALKLSQESNFDKGEASSLYNLGLIKFFNEDYSGSAHYWKLSLTKWTEIGNEKKILQNLESLGRLALQQSDFSKAISYYQSAANKSRSYKRDSLTSKYYRSIGEVYAKIGDFKKSISHLRIAKNLIVDKESKDFALTSKELGNSYSKIQADSSEFFYREALNLFISIRDTAETAETYLSIGKFHFDQGSFDDALVNLENGLPLASSLKNKGLYIDFNLLSTKIYLLKGRLNLALEFVTATNEYSEYYNVSQRVFSLELFSKIYYQKKQFKEATFYYSQYTQKNDSLREDRYDKKIATLNAKYEYDVLESELKKESILEKASFERLLKEREIAQYRLVLFFLFILVILLLLTWFLILSKKRRKSLLNQQKELEALLLTQREVIEEKTSELINSQETISHYAFLNSHELRAPLTKILSIIYLLEQVDVQKKFLYGALKASAHELEEAANKILKDLSSGKDSKNQLANTGYLNKRNDNDAN